MGRPIRMQRGGAACSRRDRRDLGKRSAGIPVEPSELTSRGRYATWHLAHLAVCFRPTSPRDSTDCNRKKRDDT